MGPPAFSFTFIVTVTFDPDLLWPLTLTLLNFDLNHVTISQTVPEIWLFSSDFFLVFVTDGQTDGQKAMPKTPPCMSAGGFKYRKLILKNTSYSWEHDLVNLPCSKLLPELPAGFYIFQIRPWLRELWSFEVMSYSLLPPPHSAQNFCQHLIFAKSQICKFTWKLSAHEWNF